VWMCGGMVVSREVCVDITVTSVVWSSSLEYRAGLSFHE
jgi:hypothetical protein